jgi:outer membrane protein OmpA-like peptidoglycan-associated protein
MALVRHVVAALLLSAATSSQAHPVPSPIPGSRLIQTSHVDGPLEVRSATADDEAVLAGTSYEKRKYRALDTITVVTFVQTYRDALFAGGWKLIATPKVDNVPPPEGVADIAAHYMANGRNIYARLSWDPDGTYEINVADVGEENWPATLAKECRLRIPSLHFDLDRPTLREVESAPTLEQLANVLKSKNAPAVEIEGHSDNVGEGGVASRQALSEARAKTVAAWLIAHGVPAAKITSKGYGKTKPIAENDTDLGRAMNRRIEIACLSPQ